MREMVPPERGFWQASFLKDAQQRHQFYEVGETGQIEGSNGDEWEVMVTNGIVKTKPAAIQDEGRIAELLAAGADVGDFGHSRKLFPAMLPAACAYIDKKTSVFLSTLLSSTGMPPHFYVTADKSTNHRATNQVTVICPVVNGCREGIVLNAGEVYTVPMALAVQVAN